MEHSIFEIYRRTDQDRLGCWQSTNTQWKTPASAGLVAHDMYHHLPDDRGTLSDEIRALGAEWYVSLEPLTEHEHSKLPKRMTELTRNARDIVLNALDSKEPSPLTLKAPSAAGDAPKLAVGHEAALAALDAAKSSPKAVAFDEDTFLTAFQKLMALGYQQAKLRFPDQALVRKSSEAFVHDLADLDESKVPIGHPIRVELTGYTCHVTYEDADRPFLLEHQPLVAYLMRWCADTEGYPLRGAALYDSKKTYFRALDIVADSEHKADTEELIPEGDEYYLQRVYVTNSEFKELLRAHKPCQLTLEQLADHEFTPRGVWVY